MYKPTVIQYDFVHTTSKKKLIDSNKINLKGKRISDLVWFNLYVCRNQSQGSKVMFEILASRKNSNIFFPQKFSWAISLL